MCECKKGKCALSLIYPKSNNATYACDDECYFSYCEEKLTKQFINSNPDEMKESGLIK